MAFSILTRENIFEKYESAKEYTDKLTVPFSEFERIARAKPKDSIPDMYPNTVDGTASSVVKKSPRRIVQQLPTGKVSSDDEKFNWLPIASDFIYTNIIIPNANQDYDLIQKAWTTIESGLTVGACGVRAPFINHDGVFSPDYVPIYWGEVAFQKGKRSAYSCDYIFIREWWQPEDIDTLIDREQRNAEQAKKAGAKYESTWIVESLKAVRDSKVAKDEQGQTPAEKDRHMDDEAIEVVTGYQVGVGAEFITFCPDREEILRVKKNRDPRGEIPLVWFYADVDGWNPFGRGIVELIGGIQNLLDSELQMYQYNRALMLNPPLLTRGNIRSSLIKFEPNAIIPLGADQNNDVSTLKIDSSALSNFSNHYSLMKSQIYNLTSANGDSSISAEAGDIQSSKTSAGVKQKQETMSIDDNFLRKSFEAMWENWSELAINLYFAERSGKEILQLDQETADKLQKLVDAGDLEQGFVNKNNQILIDYDTATPALHFKVDATTSKKQSEGEQQETLSNLIDKLDSSQILQQVVPQDKVAAAWNALVATSGIEDPELLSIDLKELQQQISDAEEQQVAQAQAAEQQSAQSSAPMADMSEREQKAIPAEIVDPSIDDQIVQYLRAMDVPEETITEAIQALDQGYSADDILAALFGGQNG